MPSFRPPVPARRRALIRRARRPTLTDAPYFLGALRDRDPEVRQAAAWGLNRLADPSLVDALLPHLWDPDPLVQSSVGWALVRAGAAAIEPVQRVYDTNPSGPTRLMAGLVLQRLGVPVDPVGRRDA